MSVRWSIRRSVGNDRVEKWKNKRFGYFLCVFVCRRVGNGVWMGVGCPCPPIRNDIVTLHHLFFSNLLSSFPLSTPSPYDLFPNALLPLPLPFYYPPFPSSPSPPSSLIPLPSSPPTFPLLHSHHSPPSSHPFPPNLHPFYYYPVPDFS